MQAPRGISPQGPWPSFRTISLLVLALRKLLQTGAIEKRDRRAIDLEQARSAELLDNFCNRLAVGVDHLGQLAVATAREPRGLGSAVGLSQVEQHRGQARRHRLKCHFIEPPADRQAMPP